MCVWKNQKSLLWDGSPCLECISKLLVSVEFPTDNPP
eukprot:UN10806